MALAAKIKLLLFDVDGVLTSGQLFIGDDGQEHKAFHSRDGHGIRMLQDSGVPVGLITGRTSQVVKHRAKDLDIKHVYQGERDKLPAYIALCKKLGLTLDQVAFVGDDVVDLPIMLKTGLAVAVQDAHPLVKQHAHWTTPSRGGRGAGRDICELILLAQGHYDQAMGHYLS
ncbi:MAG TPA: 3-deoxy-manno-octulosonate-8-phosphatase KdsC [Acidiferrobacteraceae bacterium]|nr:3-deoxy-manno-octulosonate-8-phosphatase KdsC [Acidiferrobacteraceae bacterium]